MAEADVFGDFTFSSSAFDPNAHRDRQSSSSSPSDDDDWGDFVTDSSSSPIKTNRFGSPADPFGFFNVSDGAASLASSGSDPTRSEPNPEKKTSNSNSSQWKKPKGALPLSLFGEEEREEQASQDLSGLTKNEGLERKASNLNGVGVGINDLISNLYVQNGSNSNSNLSSNGFDSKLNGLDGVNVSSNGFKFDGLVSNGSSNSNVEEGNGDFDDDDDDGWEFKAAESESVKEQGAVEVAELKPESSTVVHRGFQENVGRPGYSGGFGIHAHELINVSVPSQGTHLVNGQWGFSFDFNPSPATQDDFFFSKTHSQSQQNSTANVSNMSAVDDVVWEFKDALPDVTGSELKWEEEKLAPPACLNQHTLDGRGADNDFFAVSDRKSHQSSGSNYAFPLIPSSGTKDGVNLDSYSTGKKDDSANSLSCPTDTNHNESGDSSWEFKDAFSESGSNLEGKSVVGNNPHTKVKQSAMGGEIQNNELTLNNQRKALPLSIFGDEDLETHDSQVHQDNPSQAAASHQINTARNPSNISITDLISSLYTQVDQNTSKIHAPKETENNTPSPTTMLESDFGGDDFDDGTWEFKDAASNDHSPTSISNFEDTPMSPKIQLDDYVDLYCKLKNESYFLALYHLDQKKKAQSGATFSGVDTKEALDEEIQKIYNSVPEDNMVSNGHQSENPSARHTCIDELHKVLEELKFQLLESEYQLSHRLSLAENDLRSAIELLRHAAAILRILRLGSAEDQSNYISAWSQMVSNCAEELKHGSLIWKQSLEKNVQKEILSDPQGQRYIIALGEIYRAVLVLGASVKLYSPWIVLHSSDCSSLFALPTECSVLWSTSGLDEALRSISVTDECKYGEAINALLDSVTNIHHVDSFSLQRQFSSGHQPICSLSLLTAEAVPGVKMVIWNEEHFLLPLANLWINLIGCDPPRLPYFSYS